MDNETKNFYCKVPTKLWQKFKVLLAKENKTLVEKTIEMLETETVGIELED